MTHVSPQGGEGLLGVFQRGGDHGRGDAPGEPRPTQHGAIRVAPLGTLLLHPERPEPATPGKRKGSDPAPRVTWAQLVQRLVDRRRGDPFRGEPNAHARVRDTTSRELPCLVGRVALVIDQAPAHGVVQGPVHPGGDVRSLDAVLDLT